MDQKDRVWTDIGVYRMNNTETLNIKMTEYTSGGGGNVKIEGIEFHMSPIAFKNQVLWAYEEYRKEMGR
uniref:Uncharacterized protein n=1 Tax=viral metagenome TaxID=1070528 RepID=A0A6M3JXJ6_9ZZZZ